MYPGTEAKPGLDIAFQDGLTLILGANGLGKTTLVTLIYRMLTGPADISSLSAGGNLGGSNLDSSPMTRYDRRLFANRVVDDAESAVATLEFGLGTRTVLVTRLLNSLDVTTIEVDGEDYEPTQANFEAVVLEAAELGSYGDWVLLLRHLTFYFEDRRSLIWDASAQRHLLRLLFLPPREAQEWKTREREILSLDSLIRNLQYSLGKQERLLAKSEMALSSADEVRQQIGLLQTVQADEDQELQRLNDEFVEVIARRQQARINALNAAQALESTLRNIERIQLAAIDTAFPAADVTARYILGHILSDNECLTCGTQVPDYASQLRRRVEGSQCPVCGAPVAQKTGARVTRELAKATKLREQLEAQVTTASSQRDASEAEYDEMLHGIADLTARTSTRSAEIDDLVRRLPTDEQDVHAERGELAAMRGRLEGHREHIQELRESFDLFVQELNRAIAVRKDAIRDEFRKFATGFLIEDCELVWSPRRSKVGETGGTIEFAAFELDMTGANFPSPVRRTGPLQVSESQREFIDLSFRMALMTVASGGSGSLVIDAPESSLDAVFVARAAAVLTRFAKLRSNRLVVTSNLVDGDLIPELIREGGITSARDRRVVDLLRVAAPTAATAKMHQQYSDIRRKLFAKARS